MTFRTPCAWVGLPVVAILCVALGHTEVTTASAQPTPATDAEYKDKVLPLLTKYCFECHNSKKANPPGGLTLDVYVSEAHARKDRKTWGAVQHALAAGDMPPKKKAQPTKEEKEFLIGWIENTLTKVDCGVPHDPGRVTLRRLNRTEYNNTIRDLCGVTVRPADDFPADDSGYGFDNIGDVLSLQPILLEKYLAAADRILDAALVPIDPIPSSKQTYRPQNILVTPRSAKTREDRPKIRLTTEGSAYLEKFNFPSTGEYAVRVRALADNPHGEQPKLAIRIDGKDVKTVAVDAPPDKPATYEVKLKVEAGERRVAAAFVNPSDPAKLPKDAKPRTLGVENIEVEGPIGGGPRPLPDSAKLIYTAIPKDAADAPQAARKILADFARRAYRRPVKAEELDRLLKLYAIAAGRGDKFDKAIRLPLKAVLVSPNFLFRIEDDPKAPEVVRTLNDHEFAARLSYFLWATMPDAELFAAAERGDLRKPDVLQAQIARMLKDPKSTSLVENFAGQWLQLRTLKTLTPDPDTFKTWDDDLRAAMVKETELYFEHIVKNDRSVLEFLDADYTFLNGKLAKHYGIDTVFGTRYREVKLPDTRRGGILTHASVLTVTSNPTRTSPVKRGKWILENVLGTPPPPPAPDVPELPPTSQLKGTLRQQMEQHRANPACATCHAKLDPLGFGLENFDGIGAWRETDNKQKIDSSGVLPDGAKFDGPAELRKVLLGKSDQFRRCLAEKLMTYALGRGLEYYDKCAVDEVVTKLKSGNDKFSALVKAIAESDAFQKRKGKRSE